MLEYKLREDPRARRINITIRRDGTVWVTKPRRASMREVEQFMSTCEQWIMRTQEKFSQFPRTSRIESSKKQFEKYKRDALHLVKERISALNAPYRHRFSKIVVRDQRSRWGSCSHGGVLSFNYRVLFLAPHLVDYIIVHELCHLQEMNHSKRFWRLVELTVPDQLARRRELRRLERGLLADS